MKSILLVGEQNPHGSDPGFALLPLPKYGSGGRLQRILGLSMLEYISRHDRLNLCRDAWNMTEAIATCIRIRAERPAGSGIILCGAKAARAFGWAKFVPFQVNLLPPELGGQVVLVLPHPSGLCRIWNDPSAVGRARVAYAELVERVAGAPAGYPRAGQNPEPEQGQRLG